MSEEQNRCVDDYPGSFASLVRREVALHDAALKYMNDMSDDDSEIYASIGHVSWGRAQRLIRLFKERGVDVVFVPGRDAISEGCVGVVMSDMEVATARSIAAEVLRHEAEEVVAIERCMAL